MTFLLRVAGLLLLAALFLVSTPTPLVSSAPPMSPSAAPILISPKDGAVMHNGCSPKPHGFTWDFSWSNVLGATAYHIKVWHSRDNPLINDMNVPSSSFHYASPLPTDHIINTNLTGWRWMVRAEVHGVWGPWSVVRSFTVERLNTDCP